jgi:hypothetical protein
MISGVGVEIRRRPGSLRKEVESHHMRYTAGIALFFSGMAFSQSSPNHFQLPDRLIDPHTPPKVLPRQPAGWGLMNLPQPAPVQPILRIGPKDTVCAIPLLNALPANSKADFRIQVIKPPAEAIDRMPVVHAMPVCSTQRQVGK